MACSKYWGNDLLQPGYAAATVLFNLLARLVGIGPAEGGAYISKVCIIVEFFLLATNGDGTYVEITLVVVGSNAGKVYVAVLGDWW